MNNLLLLHVDLVASTMGECAIGGSELFFLCRVNGVSPFRTVGINQVSAHISLALVDKEALTVGSIEWTSGPVFHDVHRGNQLPRPHDSVSNLRFGLSKNQRTAEHKSQQRRETLVHLGLDLPWTPRTRSAPSSQFASDSH